MVKNYKDFLEKKDNSHFWKKAKQREYTARGAIEKIVYDLGKGFSSLTTRNSITLRFLGFVINEGNNNLKISNAGETFISSPYKQKILDEQLMKVYLSCQEINPRISIDIIPMRVIIELLLRLDYFTKSEYERFICWINHYSEIPIIIDFIKAYRDESVQDKYDNIFNQKVKDLKISDFNDNVGRLLNMLKLSSYLHVEKNEKMEIYKSKVKKSDLGIILKSFNANNFTAENYYQYLTVNNGWQIYSNNIEYLQIVKTLDLVNPRERKKIVKEIKSIAELPNLNEIIPERINLTLGKNNVKSKVPINSRKRVAKKLNYELRDAMNRRHGDFAEKIVIKYELEYLAGANKKEYSEKISQVSLKDDTLGYDILSFDIFGKEKHIEVKGVRNTPNSKFVFYISSNEMEIAKNDPSYHLYIVFDYLSLQPKIFQMKNPFTNDIPGVTIVSVKNMVTVEIENT